MKKTTTIFLMLLSFAAFAQTPNGLAPAGSTDPTMGGDLSGTVSNAQIVANAVGTAELSNGKITLAKIDTLTANRVLVTDGSGRPVDGTLSGILGLSGGVLSAIETDGSTTNELTTFTSSGSAPGSPKEGDIWHKTGTDSAFIRTSAPAWEFLAIRAGGGGGTSWILGGQNTTANASIGPNDAFRFSINTNGTARQNFSSDGRIFGGTVTDWIMSPTDSAALRVGANGWIHSTAFSRLVANGLVSLQANHSTGAVAMVAPDNTATAFSLGISGGQNAFVLNSTDGAEITTVGTSSTGAITNIKAPTLQVNGTLVSNSWQDGVWTPTLTNTTNVSASTAYQGQVLYIGKTVHFSGQVDIDPTTTGITVLGMSLPIATDFTQTQQAGGVGVALDGEVFKINASVANDNLTISFTATNTANNTFNFSGSYRIQ